VWLPIDGSGQNGRWQTDGAFAGYTDWNVVQNSDVSYGDCYDGANKTLYVDPDTSYVSLGYDPINPLAGSQAALSGSGSDWTLTFRIPKDLGPGSPYAYWPVGTPTITGVRLTEGRILGLQFIYAPQDASPNTPKYGNQWSTIAEIDRYYKCRLTQGPASISAKYKCGDPSQPNDNQIKPHLTIVNTGQTAVPLSELTVRYWYTIDGNKPQQFWVDYATRGSQNVTGSFVQTSRQGADYYLEVGFTSGAGILNPQSDSGEIQLRFNKNDWTNYTETGDYSYDPSKTIYTTWNRVTIYRNGVLIYGVEP
ncbi:MAG TPA: cellulose binding domain-containing protein, partial [Bacillota bacterium]|nr:cellulose binding domain-containing protein [Bacillota bacterium]